MANTGPRSPLIDWTTDEIVDNVLNGTFYKSSVYNFLRRHKGEYPHVEAAIVKLNYISFERSMAKYTNNINK